MVGSVYKNIDYSDARVIEFKSHASVYVDSLLDQYGTKLFIGKFNNTKISYSDESAEIINEQYTDIIHHGIDNLFYNDFQFKPLSKLGQYNTKQQRNINTQVSVISIPRSLYIEGIVPNTVELTIDSFSFRDDGFGNLIDTNRENTTYDEIIPNLEAWYSFDEGFMYTTGSNIVYPNTQIVIDYSQYYREGTYHDVTWSYNSKNYYAKFNGTSSYIDIPNNNIDFNKSFAISFLAWSDLNTKTILHKQNGTIYPFKFYINNTGRLEVSMSDGINTYTATSTTQLVGGLFSLNWFHILFQYDKTNSKIELIINGILESTVNASFNGIINNDSEILIGKQDSVFYKGQLDDLMIFNKVLTPTQYLDFAVRQKHTSDNFNYYSGNVFYSLGFIVITHGRHRFITELSDYVLQFKSTRTIYEHEYTCNIEPNEFNSTYNKSILTNYTDNRINTNFINTEWNPYVSSIGLYDDNLNLLAVGKVSTPSRILKNNKMSFIVKFDLVDDNVFELFPSLFVQSNFICSDAIEGDVIMSSVDITNISKNNAVATINFKIPLLAHKTSESALLSSNEIYTFDTTKLIPVNTACDDVIVYIQNAGYGSIETPIHSIGRMLESNCIWIEPGGQLQFSVPIQNGTVTHSGTATLNISGNNLVCPNNEFSQGTVFNLKFKDLSNNEYHFPIAEGCGVDIHDVNAINYGVLVDGVWTIQSSYHYNITYGVTKLTTVDGILYVPYDKTKTKIYTT